MATGNQIKALLESHAADDQARFYAIAAQIAATEARRGHDKLADELRAMIDAERAKAKLPSKRGLGDSVVSISKPRGEAANLLYPAADHHRMSQLVVGEEIRALLEQVVEEQSHYAEIKSHGLVPRRTLLFSGPPGCGKTMAASVVANRLGLPLFAVRLDAIVTRYLGESSSKLRAVFEAIEETRAVYLFDEFDSLGLERGSTQDVAEMRRVLNSFLVFVETYRGNSLVIAATNHVESLDLALFRRFDDLVEFSMPTREQAEKALEQRLLRVENPDKLELSKVAAESEGLSFADLARAVDDALKSVIIGRAKALSTSLLLAEINKRKGFLSRNRKLGSVNAS